MSDNGKFIVHVFLFNTNGALTIEFLYLKGRDKNPAFNLSAFFWPQTLLSIFKLETFRLKNQNEENPCLETLVFQTEMTARDKEHVGFKELYFSITNQN